MWLAIAAGFDYSLALKSGRHGGRLGRYLWHWSRGAAGWSERGWRRLPLGVHHSLALKKDGTVVGWGTN